MPKLYLYTHCCDKCGAPPNQCHHAIDPESYELMPVDQYKKRCRKYSIVFAVMLFAAFSGMVRIFTK